MKTLKTLIIFAIMSVAGMLNASATPDVKYFQPRELIQLSTDVVDMTYDQTTAEVVVTAKSAYEMYCRCPWLKATQVGKTITVTAEKNTGFVPRTARVILTTKKENVSRVITVVQKPEPGHDKYFALPTTGNIYPMVKMDLSNATHDNFIKEISKNKSIEGKKVAIKGNTYETSVSTHAQSVFTVNLNGAMRFVADLGIDDEILDRSPETHGDVIYKVLLDDKEVASGRITIVDKQAVSLDINTHGAKKMKLIFDTNGSNWGDHVDLGNPYFELTADKPEVVAE